MPTVDIEIPRNDHESTTFPASKVVEKDEKATQDRVPCKNSIHYRKMIFEQSQQPPILPKKNIIKKESTSNGKELRNLIEPKLRFLYEKQQPPSSPKSKKLRNTEVENHYEKTESPERANQGASRKIFIEKAENCFVIDREPSALSSSASGSADYPKPNSDDSGTNDHSIPSSPIQLELSNNEILAEYGSESTEQQSDEFYGTYACSSGKNDKALKVRPDGPDDCYNVVGNQEHYADPDDNLEEPRAQNKNKTDAAPKKKNKLNFRKK